MGGLEAREIGIKKGRNEVRGWRKAAWGASRPRRDKTSLTRGVGTPLVLGVMGGVEQGKLPGPRQIPGLRTELSGSVAVPELGRHCGAEGARRGSPRSSNVGGRGPCGRGPVLAGSAGVLRSWLSGPAKNYGTRVWGLHSARSRAYCVWSGRACVVWVLKSVTRFQPGKGRCRLALYLWYA